MMWSLLYIYLLAGMIVLVRNGIGRHVVNGFRVLVIEYFVRPGIAPKTLAVFVSLPVVVLSTVISLGLYPVMLYTRKRNRRAAKTHAAAAYRRNIIPGYPPVFYN